MYDALKTHVDFAVVKAVLIGRCAQHSSIAHTREVAVTRCVCSPGFLKDDFVKYMTETAVRQEDVSITRNRGKFVVVHASGGHRRSVGELLSDEGVLGQLGDAKAAEDVLALQRFHAALAADQDRACYGYVEVRVVSPHIEGTPNVPNVPNVRQVLNADAHLAVQELLVTDRLFKAAAVAERRMYVSLVEAVRAHGGRVWVLSSQHVSGAQLDMYTGVAATLRFPLPQPDLDRDDVSTDSSADGRTR